MIKLQKTIEEVAERRELTAAKAGKEKMGLFGKLSQELGKLGKGKEKGKEKEHNDDHSPRSRK